MLVQTANQQYRPPLRDFINIKELAGKAVGEMQEVFPALSDYSSVHYLINHENFPLAEDIQEKIEHIEAKNNFNHTRLQAEEIMQRYSRIRQIMQQSVSEEDPVQRKLFTERLDNIFASSNLGLSHFDNGAFSSVSKYFLACRIPDECN